MPRWGRSPLPFAPALLGPLAFYLTSSHRYVDANLHFHPFRLACESSSAKVKRTALDQLQKLMAYGQITGSMVTKVEGVRDITRLVDLVVDVICRCFVGEHTDEVR